MANILIASLGESPVVVPVIYHLLKDREGIEIDEVHVLAPQGKKVLQGLKLIEGAFPKEYPLKKVNLDFEDANTQQYSIQFLQELAMILHEQQQGQHNVYLSMAGGRKSMAALIAWIVPFFSCIKGLYHVVDPNKDQFPTIDELYDRPTDIRKLLMHPTKKERDALMLVEIPFNREQQISEKALDRLLSVTEEELEGLSEETAAAIETTQRVFNRDRVLEVLITQPALKQYEKFRDTDETRAQLIRKKYFQKMDSASQLQSLIHPWRGKTNVKSGPVTLHFCKSARTDVRLVVYTEPQDVYSGKIEEVEKVVICGFEIEKEGRKPFPYRSLAEIAAAPHFSRDPISTVDKLMPVYENTGEEHVLLVPLGTHPMIATQLYTLLSEKGMLIKEIVVFYPELNRNIYNGVKLLEKVVRDEKRFSDKSIEIKSVVIAGRKDIDSKEACAEYQQKLEHEIESLQRMKKPVLLSLSGGRKGMAAMAIFVAQRMNLRCVYHTLIEDEKLSDRIDEETTIKALNDPALTKNERNDRLFLRSYDPTKFTLFKVPVLSKEQLLME